MATNGTATRRSHLPALVFLALAATALFALPLARGEVFTLRDHFDYFQPLRWFTAMELQAGRLPLWNPYNASGEPWLANPQTGIFYPPAWLMVVLPFATGYMLFLLFHVILMGWGSYLLFVRTASRGAALAGATALMFSGPFLSLLDVSNNLATLAWIPLALWCASEGAWRRGGLVLALAFLGGEPFFAAVAGLLYAIVGAGPFVRKAASGNSQLATHNSQPATHNPQPATSNRWRPLVLAALVAMGVSAVQLLPFLEMVRASDRAAGLDAATILSNSMRWSDWLRVVLPPRFVPAAEQQFIPILYAGLVVGVLAVVGIRRRTLGWVLLLAFAVGISLGPEWLVRLPLTLFRYPARLVPLGVIALAALAVAGYERIRGGRRWLDAVLLLILIADLVPRMTPLLRTAPFRTDAVPYSGDVGKTSKILRVGAIDPEHRAAWISGYLNLYGRRFSADTAAPVTSERYARMHRGLLEKPTREELAQKGIGWVVTSHDLSSSFTPNTEAEGVRVFRNHVNFPMAALLVRNPLRLIPARVTLDTSTARVSVDAPREGVVLLHQQDARGWRATVDGVDAGTNVRGELFRAVQITRGHHEIVWEYRPRSFTAGASITVLTLLALTLSSFVKRARRRKIFYLSAES